MNASNILRIFKNFCPVSHFFIIVVLFIVVLLPKSFADDLLPWDADVIPPNLDTLVSNSTHLSNFNHVSSTASDKLIPRNLWIAFRIVPPENKMYPHLKTLIPNVKSKGWTVNLIGDHKMDLFMKTFYPDTSLLWAYELIHKEARVAAVDLWRYAALYAFGGVYMDDDADFKTPLDTIIQPLDSMILATEGNQYWNQCYVDNFFLSNNYMKTHYNTSIVESFFNGKNLVNWGIFAQPRHPIVKQLLSNIVEIIRGEYFGKRAIKVMI